MDRSLSIFRRPLDLGLVIFFVLSILYGFLDSLPEAIGLKVTPDSPWPPLRSDFGSEVSPPTPKAFSPAPVKTIAAILLFQPARSNAWISSS